MGAMQELVQDGRNGFLVEPGNARQFAEKVQQVFKMDSAELRLCARKDFELNYTAEANHEWLINIYSKTLASRVSSSAAPDLPMQQQASRQNQVL